MASAREQVYIRRSRNDFGSALLLQLGQPANMIVMGMANEQKLYVRYFETESRNVAFDLRRRLDKTAIDQEITLRRRNQERRDFSRSDIVKISDDPKRPTGLFQARLISSAWPKTQAGEIRKIRIINADARAEEESALLAPIIVFPEGKLGLYFRLSLVATSRASQIGEHRESFFG